MACRLMARGAFIVFEGGDRCGKTTQCERLVDGLRKLGAPCVSVRFPDRTASTGTAIDAYMRGIDELSPRDVHALFVRERRDRRAEIEAALESGATVVADRYACSGVAYADARGGMDWEALLREEAGLPVPDVVICMRLDPGAAAARDGYGCERHDSVGFQRRVSLAFDRLASEPSMWRRWIDVDASRDVDAVARDVEAAVFSKT